MKPSILHPLRESRHARRHRRGAGRTLEPADTVQPAHTVEPAYAAEADRDTAIIHEPVSQPCDPDARRVREAGGPIDRASYTCSCGYVFRASVSTSVSCPHCGADQAW